jgi:FkbM family methyltransferase
MTTETARQSFSLNDLDRKLERYVDFDGGTIFEAGANNGINQSNSLYFEMYRGWRSILVEPIPKRFFECVVNRPNALVEWGALVPPPRKGELITLTYCNLMTVTRNSAETRAWEDDHVSRGTRHMPGEKLEDFKARGNTISAILDKHRITHVDVMSLDIEGYEIPALQGINWARHRPTWLLIEVRDEPAMNEYLAPYYEQVDKLSHHDFLYRVREPLP